MYCFLSLLINKQYSGKDLIYIAYAAEMEESMKKVLVCKEKDQLETRVALIPDDIKKLTAMGFEFSVVSGAGLKSGFSDEAYKVAGAEIVKTEEDAYEDSEIVVRIMKPESTKGLKKDTLHISYFDPFHEKELLQEVAEQGIQLVSLEMIPRTTLDRRWTYNLLRLPWPVMWRY